jgi:hypothetical protein
MYVQVTPHMKPSIINAYTIYRRICHLKKNSELESTELDKDGNMKIWNMS